MWRALLLPLLLVVSSHDRLEIRVTPHTPMAGDSIRLTCRVEPNDANRWLVLGLVDYRTSGVQLDGAQAAITHTVTYDHVPCVDTAYCLLYENTGRQIQRVETVEVAGCDR